VANDLKVANTTMFTPTGYGSNGAYAFADFGGTPNQAYSTNQSADCVAQAGFGIGDYQKSVSVEAFITVNDVSKFGNFSYNFIASRAIGSKTAMSVGATHLFADPQKTDGLASYYVAVSSHIASERSAGNPTFSYTAGYGNGRFLMKSERDSASGKGTQGTGFFGSVSYAVSKTATLNAEWTGMNLAITSSFNIKPGLPSLYVGVTDLTRYTGDKPVFMIGVGQTFGFSKH
jgi:hypothetical protein